MGKMRNCGMRNAEGKMRNGMCGTTVIGHGKGYFAECGLRNAESCQRVICGKFDADFFLRNEG